MELLVYNSALIINNFLSSLLVFITYFYVLPKSKNVLNYILTIIICTFFTIFDAYNPNVPNLSSIFIILIAIFSIKSKYMLTERIMTWNLSLFLVAITQGIGSAIIIGLFPTISDPKTSIQSIILFTLLTILNYTITFIVLIISKKLIKCFNLNTILKDHLVSGILLSSLIILNLFYLSLDSLTKYINIDHSYLNLTITIILVTIIFISIGTSMLIYSHTQEIKNRLKLEQLNERYAYINELEKNNDELRKFKHDYKNLLLSLSASINNDDNNDLKSSIKKLLNYQGDINSNSENKKSNLYKLTDKLVKGILVSKLILAKDKKITANFEIDDRVKIPSKYSVDITRILGIFLDNAIEACLETKTPELDFGLIQFDGYIEFIVKNNIASTNTININSIFKDGYSTKKDHSGLGLASVKEMVDSNNDLFLQTKIKDGYYSTILTVLE
ncbi:hypothetical protein CPR19088_GLDEOEPO_02177 [Companilactobacillus paralimentarius]